MRPRKLHQEPPTRDIDDTPLSAAVAQRDSSILDTVRRAVQDRDVMLAYQPVVAASGRGRPVFYEGLIRILDRTGRIIPARDFIAAVEADELGRMIDCVALEMGLVALARAPGLRLSINMSARSIGYPRWTQTLNNGLAQHPTIARRLILEVNEKSALQMPELVIVFIKDLRQRGITFALDNFGAEHTSFRYLRDFMFDIVKIDGQFIRGIHQSPDNQVMVQAMLALAGHLDMLSVAETVETAADAEFLRRAGVGCLQGYFLGAPSVTPPWARGKSAKQRA